MAFSRRARVEELHLFGPDDRSQARLGEYGQHEAGLSRNPDGLGAPVRGALNTYKPFACGIVIHPAIDAAIQLRNENQLTADQIEPWSLRSILWCSN